MITNSSKVIVIRAMTYCDVNNGTSTFTIMSFMYNGISFVVFLVYGNAAQNKCKHYLHAMSTLYYTPPL